MAVLDPRRETPRKPLPLGPALRAQQARELTRRLGSLIKGEIRLQVTDNKAVMISVQRDLRHGIFQVRLHHLFVDAPVVVLHSLARYIVYNDRAASRDLNSFIDAHHQWHGASSSSHRTVLRTQGRIHDLKAIFDELNARYFAGQARSRITWGRHVLRGKRRRSIKLGSFSLEEGLIRIHPGLDQEWIPRFYLQWVIYHEMLHSMLPIPVVKGRHSFHTSTFAQEERRFAEHAQAAAWERRNVAALLCL